MLLTHYLSTEEDAKTATLIGELRQARVRGYLKRDELEKYADGNQHAPFDLSKATAAHASGRRHDGRSQRVASVVGFKQ